MISETVLLALIATIPPTLGTIGAIWIGLRNGQKADVNARKSDLIADKADVIAGHVNSAASASTAKIEGLQAQVAQMHQTVSNQQEVAALLAQSVATAMTEKQP